MEKQELGKHYLKRYIILILYCVFLNFVGDWLKPILPYNLNINVIGVMLAGLIGGYLPSIIVVILTTIIKFLITPKGAYFGVLALLYSFGSAKLRKMYIKRNYIIPVSVYLASYLFIFLIAIANSFILYSLRGTLELEPNIFVNLLLSRYDFKYQWGYIIGNIIFLTFEKLVCMYVTIFLLKIIPRKLKKDFYYVKVWQDWLPDDVEEKVKVKSKHSINNKLFWIINSSIFVVSIVSFLITFSMFRNAVIHENTKTAQSVINFITDSISVNEIKDIKENGYKSIYFEKTKRLLTTGLNTNEDIQFVYIYDVKPEHVSVVLDIDVPGWRTEVPGEQIEIPQEMKDNMDFFVSGKEVGPVITNDETYGRLLSYFKPIKTVDGEILCYLCCDVSMDNLTNLWTEFVLKFLYFIIAIIIAEIIMVQWFIDKSIIRPVKALSVITGFFANDIEDNRYENLKKLEDIHIRTKDEVEDLYHSVLDTLRESTNYIEEIQHNNEVMSQMQHNLIVMLAELVESRDNDTGQHIKKTASYVNIIGRKMLEKGYYADTIDEEFIEHITEAAPLHDIGKIQVSDIILRKPGKLTDEEFEEMKKHTVFGGEILENAIKLMPEMKYLKQARFMAEYHHEKWNGKGYPHQLKGNDIPLAARIMAVADVFDALVSVRVYKPPFTFEEAIELIKKERGQHFDPLVVDAFLDSLDEVRRVKEQYEEV